MQQEIYRQAASLMIFRPSPELNQHQADFEVLLLHKPRKRDAWQLPQGGAEGEESIEQTALRELEEEAGLTDVQLLGQSANVYQYDFPASFRRFRPDHIKGQRICYIFAMTTREAAITVDGNEIDRYVWTTPDRLHLYIQRKEYLQLMLSLVEEGKKLLPKDFQKADVGA